MSSIGVSVGPHFSTDPISHVLLTGIHYPPTFTILTPANMTSLLLFNFLLIAQKYNR